MIRPYKGLADAIEAAKRLDFEQAAELRDRLKSLRKQQIK